MNNHKIKKGEVLIRLTTLGQYFGQLFTTPLGSDSAQIRSPDFFLREVVELDDVTLRHSVEDCYVDILWRQDRLYRLFTTPKDDGTYMIRFHCFACILHNIGGIEEVIEKYQVSD